MNWLDRLLDFLRDTPADLPDTTTTTTTTSASSSTTSESTSTETIETSSAQAHKDELKQSYITFSAIAKADMTREELEALITTGTQVQVIIRPGEYHGPYH